MAPFLDSDTAAYLSATFIVFCRMGINLVNEKYRQTYFQRLFSLKIALTFVSTTEIGKRSMNVVQKSVKYSLFI